MVTWLIKALKAAVAALRCEFVGEREEWRRGMAERLPRAKRGERLWFDDEDETAI